MRLSIFAFKWLAQLKVFVFLYVNTFLFFLHSLDSRLEGWISLPSKNTKRFGWDKKVMNPPIFLAFKKKKNNNFPIYFYIVYCFPFPLQYVVVSSKKILFYNSEVDREQANPFMTLDLEWVIKSTF